VRDATAARAHDTGRGFAPHSGEVPSGQVRAEGRTALLSHRPRDDTRWQPTTGRN
jgi:hypothetical protein